MTVRKIFIVVFLIFPLVQASQAQEPKVESICFHDGKWDATYLDCLNRVRDMTADERRETEERLRLGQEEEQMRQEIRRAVADQETSAQTVGSASSLRSFLPKVATTLGLGDFSEEEGSFTLTFNPPFLQFEKAQVAIETTVNEPELYEPLTMSIAEAERESVSSELKEGLEDLDDLAISLAWNVETRRLGRRFDKQQELFGHLFSGITNQAAEAFSFDSTVNLAAFLEAHSDLDLTAKPKDLWASESLRAGALEDRILEFVVQSDKREAARRRLIKQTGFTKLADVTNNQPQLFGTLSYRSRDDLAGPDEWSLGITYEHGFGNLNGLRDWSEQKAGTEVKVKNDQEVACEVMEKDDKVLPGLGCLRGYLHAKGGWLQRAPRLTFKGTYTTTNSYALSLPEQALSLSLGSGEEATVSATGGLYLWGVDQGDEARLDLEAKYVHIEDDPLDDPMKVSRLVATLTLTQKISDDLSFAVGAVYSDKPEFRGEVNKEFSTRFGLMFKVDKKKDK